MAPKTITTPSADKTAPELPQDGQEHEVTPPVLPTAPTPGDAVKAASERLSGAGQVAAITPDAPQAATPPSFDFSSLSADQLAQLKAMLNATPDRALVKAANPTLTIRKFTGFDKDGVPFGGYVVDFKNAFQTYVRDEIANVTKEEVMIPVKFLGGLAFVNVIYRDFMNSPQVRCEVLKTRNEPGRIVEGMVESKETGRWIEREVKTMDTWFTIKMPADAGVAELELPAYIANA